MATDNTTTPQELLKSLRNFLQEGIGWADTSGMTHDSYEEFCRHMNAWTVEIDRVLAGTPK